MGVVVARLDARATDRTRYRPGWEFGVRDELRWLRAPALIEGSFGASLRLLPREATLSVGQNAGLAGLQLGPLELVGGVGLSLLNLGIVRGAGDLGMFWPRALGTVSVAIGALRVGAVAQVEYAWHWFGPDQYVRGLGLSVSLRQPALRRRFD